MPPRPGAAVRQRLWLGGLALAALVGAGLLATSALSDTATYFETPARLAQLTPMADDARPVRLGGLVKPGSIARDGLQLAFVMTDGRAEVPVVYEGIVPDLFRESQGVVATGRLEADGRFHASRLLARHDENYMPPEVARALTQDGPA